MGEVKPKEKKNVIKNFIFNHKKLSIIIGGYLLIMIVGIIIVVINNLDLNNSKKDLCIVSFDMAGSSKAYVMNTKCGTTIDMPDEPVKEGFDFVGWYINDELFDFTTVIDKDIVLTAKFKAKDNVEIVTVTFNTNGGTYIAPIELKKGTNINEPIEPILIGYKLQGWYLDDKLFDFNTIIDKDIVLTANWKKDDTTKSSGKKNKDSNNVVVNNNIDMFTQTKSDKKYKCTGAYFANGEDKNVSTDYTVNLNYLWYSGVSYSTYECKIIYKSSNEKVATISNTGEINTKSTGTTKISECIVDIETNTELGCFQANLNVSGRKCNYTTASEAQNTHVEQISNGETRPWSYGYYFSYEIPGCEVLYKSSNSSVAKFNDKNEMVGISTGKTVMSECIKETSTNKILECYDVNVNVEESSDDKEKKGNALLKAIDGYYWYLDGYNYAYIYPTVIPWYDHKALNWESEYIEIENNKFVTTEDTNIMYYSSSNIHNKFLVNPTEFAYSLVDDYGMKVSNNKLYITLGGKTYSFTKYTSKKSVDTHIELSSFNKNISLGDTIEFEATVTPSIVDHRLYSQYNNSYGGLKCNDKKIANTKWKITCEAIEVGTSTIRIIDSYTNAQSNLINVNIEYKSIHPTKMVLDKYDVTLKSGESATIKASFEPKYANDQVTWTSNNTSVATVKDGKITAKGYGTATITVKTANGLVATVNVSVTKSPLIVDGNIGVETHCNDILCASMNYAEVKATGGTERYTYNLKVYKNGVLKAEINNLPNPMVYFTKENGTFDLEYSVTDSDGETKSGRKTFTLSL